MLACIASHRIACADAVLLRGRPGASRRHHLVAAERCTVGKMLDRGLRKTALTEHQSVCALKSSRAIMSGGKETRIIALLYSLYTTCEAQFTQSWAPSQATRSVPEKQASHFQGPSARFLELLSQSAAESEE